MVQICLTYWKCIKKKKKKTFNVHWKQVILNNIYYLRTDRARYVCLCYLSELFSITADFSLPVIRHSIIYCKSVMNLVSDIL